MIICQGCGQMDTNEAKNILISVIVPAYNIENYLPRCLDSILGQTHQNLEVIVVDDGSQDSTGDIIDDYAKKDPRIIPIHKENEGVSKARTSGLKRAVGAYIGFIDGDDIADPKLYEVLLRNALEYQADISHCGYKMVFPDGREELFYGTGRIEVLDRQKGLLELMTGRHIEPSLCNKIYLANIVRAGIESPLWDSNLKINEDVLLNYLLFKQAEKSVYEDLALYSYMRREDSATSSEVKRYKITDPLRVISIIKEDTAYDAELHPIVYDRYLRVLINISQQRDSLPDAEEARKKLIKEMKNRNSFNSGQSSKLRLMVFGAAKMPGCFRVIRKIYDKKTGAGTKFKV